MSTRPPEGLPSFVCEDDGEQTEHHQTVTRSGSPELLGKASAARRPYLLFLTGSSAGTSLRLHQEIVTIGRADTCTLHIDDTAASRVHARLLRVGSSYMVEDVDSANGTFVNEDRVTAPVRLEDGDKIRIGKTTVLKFALFDVLDESYERTLRRPASSVVPPAMESWAPESWREKPVAQAVEYADAAGLDRALAKLKSMPPLVTSWEIEDLKRLLADAQEGRRFLLQGGDCAETLADCEPSIITNKLKILIQMSLVLIRGARRPVIRVGRFAGQYAKPRSNPTETRDGVELPSYFGDLVNRPDFTAESRKPDPSLLLAGYFHAAVTLNFIRAVSAGGFSDLRRPEYFDLSYFERADLPTDVRTDYQRMCREITDGLHFLHAVGDGATNELMKINFFTSHEGLNLLYESAQTRSVPRREGFYDLTTHMPWIGERTRQLTGAHIEFFRGIANPIGVKIGPKATPEEVLDLCMALNPTNEPGKLVLVARMGVKNVGTRLEPLVAAVRAARRRVLWVSDPMHGNVIATRSGTKTRDFEDILREIEVSMDIHERLGTYLGGVHFELTGEDVTECIGGGLSEADLSRNYATSCDPRLNYRQAIQMAFSLARRLSQTAPSPSTVPPPSRYR